MANTFKSDTKANVVTDLITDNTAVVVQWVVVQL